MTPRFGVSRIGLVNPKAQMLAQICSTCLAEWVRALFGSGLSVVGQLHAKIY